jgi:hypothetical protein
MCNELDSIGVILNSRTSNLLGLTSFRHVLFCLRIPCGRQFSSTSRHSEHVFFWTVSLHAQLEFIFRLNTTNSDLCYSVPVGRRQYRGRVL